MKTNLLFCLSLLIMFSCTEKKSNNDFMTLKLENMVYIDNYYLFRANNTCFKIMDEKYRLDSVNQNVRFQTALKLNKLNNDLDNIFISIRHDFISNLKGNEHFEADTLKLEQVANLEDKKYTKEFYNNRFSNELDKLNSIQKELTKCTNNDICDTGLLEEIWKEKDLSAKEFIIRLTMSNNMLNKKINCIYETIIK